MAQRVITLNIEGDKHLDSFLKVFKELQPSIICLQELFELDIPRIMEELNMTSYQYVPTMRVTKEDNLVKFAPKGNWGVAILTNLKVQNCDVFYYSESSELKEFEGPNDSVRVLIISTLSDGIDEYHVATTHFTWSPEGQATDLQRGDFNRLKDILVKYPDLILCGDFNAPRGREIFSRFEELYQDNVPGHVTTTIDSTKHYSGNDIQLVVDSIFSTPSYQISNVQMLQGVSDHLGITALISKK